MRIIALYSFVCFLLSFTTLISYAQLDTPVMGGKALSLANSTICNQDVWAVSNNIGALSDQKESSIGIAYSTRYGISELNSFSLAAVTPIKIGLIGLEVSRFGNELYHEQLVGLGFAKKIKYMSLGAKISYAQVGINDPSGYLSSTVGTLYFSVGGVAILHKKLLFGLHAHNISQSTLPNQQVDYSLPVILKTGLSYQPIKKIHLNAEVEKDIAYDAQVKIGIDFNVYGSFSLRAGMRTAPYSTALGLAFAPKKYSIDYGIQIGSTLGQIHQLSIAYKFGYKSKE